MSDHENMMDRNEKKKAPPDPTPSEQGPIISKCMTAEHPQNNNGLSQFNNITQEPLECNKSSQVCDSEKVEESREENLQSQTCESEMVEVSKEDKLQDHTCNSEVERESREEKLQRFWEETEKAKTALEESLDEKKKENERLADEITKCKNENKDLEIMNLAILKEKEKIEKEKSSLERAKHDAQEQTKKAENSFKKMQNELMKVENEKTREEKRHNEIIENLHKRIQTLTEEKDTALNRLSAMAGAKLMQGNAGIADLSDSDRPTKLAERMSEVYDNEWTNAFEELKAFLGKGRNELNEEEETIHILLDILQYIFNRAKLLTSSYRANLCCDISRIPVQSVDKGKEDSSTSQQNDVFLTIPVEKSKEVLKHVSDICIRMAADCSLVFQKHIMPDIESRLMTKLNISTETTEETLSFPDVIEYAKSCARLCWLMGIRDPPIQMVFSATLFDKDIVKEYTKRGKEIKYFVWPILYLHENGPLLSKGIVQGKGVQGNEVQGKRVELLK